MRAALARVSALAAVGMLVVAVAPAAAASSHRTPVVLFPAYHFTKLRIEVHGQTGAPGCPRSGTFTDWFLNDHPGTRFSQVCKDRLLTLRYDAGSHGPMRLRFHERNGVDVDIIAYGKTASAPFYEPMYQALEGAGWVRDRSIRVAGYDSRLTPDMGGFLHRTKRLIEDTYRDNGNRPVHLVGHSNGPLYAQYLLTHTSRRWKHRFIQGFTPIAGNLPGQGLSYALLFSGLNVTDFTLPPTTANARSSARMLASAPSTYMSAADPAVFGRREVVVRDASTGTGYTPADYRRLLADADLGWAIPVARHYIGFVRFRERRSFPNVDVYAEKGSGLATAVGVGLPNLRVGQVLGPTTPFFTRDGDINQEDITNDAVRAWRGMECFRFSLNDSPGVDHFSLPADPGLLQRLLAHLRRPRSDCA